MLSEAVIQITVRIVEDNTGRQVLLPTLVTGAGLVSDRLLEYQLLHNDSGKSLSWQKNLLLALRLLLEYSEANAGKGAKPSQLLRRFQSSLYNGTMDANGEDPSGLFWSRMKRERVRNLITQITNFTTWLHEEYDAPEMNPLRVATNHESTIQMLAWARRNKQSFLGHAESEAAARKEAGYISALGTGKVRPKVIGEAKRSFPDDRFSDLILRGFVRDDSIAHPLLRLNLRDVLITLLIYGGGVRASEAFHLWFDDVVEHPIYRGLALVRIGHPELGEVPKFDPLRRTIVGKWSKAEALASMGLRPLTELVNAARVGWKNPTLDGKWFLEVRWFPRQYGEMFWQLWILYTAQLVGKPRAHPFAWLTPRDGIYKMEHYRRNLEAAATRIGLASGREFGTRKHGFRHAYGQRLAACGLSRVLIQRCMHHHSILSQEVYTEPEKREITAELNAAEALMMAGAAPSANQIIEVQAQNLRLFESHGL